MRRDYNDRLSLSEAAYFVGKLLAQWPRAPTDEPYMLALAAALRAYPRCVAIAAIDPVTGIPHEKTFGLGPTVADVHAWCEHEVAWMVRTIDADNSQHLLAKQAAERTDPDRGQRPTLEELRRKHGPRWGIDPASTSAQLPTDYSTSPAAAAKDQNRLNAKMLAEYERLGQTPIYAAPGILVSPALAKQLRGIVDGDHR